MNIKTTRHLLVLLVCSISFSGFSQQSPTQKSSNNQPFAYRGHQLYKKTKLAQQSSKTGKPSAQPDKAIERIKFEQEMLKDPVTGRIPDQIRDLELQYASKLPETKENNLSQKSGDRFSFWKKRGPFNVGGRTRAMAIDRTNENVILAGGVSSGMWRSDDQGLSWRKTTRKNQQANVTCLVQDPRPRKGRIWYYGTGESFGNSASAFFTANYDGSGIYKSVNGGRSWTQLRATSDGDETTRSDFDIINSLAVQKTTGHLYAATETGIFRSSDEGNSFEKVFEPTQIGYNEVMITPNGRIYITVTDENRALDGNFFTSLDGNTWENITPLVIDERRSPERTIMDFNPLNENEVYFLARKGFPATLLKYNALADVTDINQKYTDLSQQLPSQIGGPVGNLNLQGRYNMVIRVHPTNPDLVFVGGTNLYRTTDGFSTKMGQESWIAGYSPANDVSLYPDQHPDQHVLTFFPSNPDRALSANDGGIFMTNNISASLSELEPVDWISLNNGYLTTQPYALSFDQEANSDDIIAGFQDNGTWTTTSTDSTAFWEEELGGDGAFNAIADGGLTRYVSFQFGNIYKFNFNEAGEYLSFAYVTPSGASGFQFVNPFVLDPNNDNIMYLPTQNVIWRNDNLDEIPTGVEVSTEVNWKEMKETSIDGFGAISALGVSKYPVSNRLYYGTSTGEIYRLDNATANLGIPAKNISEGKDLPEGFIIDINVDPSNSDRVIATYSNYNIKSLFLTEDGGDTWINISGNLEQNPDGSGNGPSVRGTAFFGSGDSYIDQKLQRVYAATSTGLYRGFLRGENTIWHKERFLVGNSLTVQVKTRKDGFIAVASHGDGVFSAKFPVFRKLPENTLQVVGSLEDITVNTEDPNTRSIAIDHLFRSSKNDTFKIEVINTNTEYITGTEIVGDSLVLTFKEDRSFANGSIGLIAKSGKEEVSVGFKVTFEPTPIYSQIDSSIGAGILSVYTDFGFLGDDFYQSADDITVPEGSSWVIENVRVFGTLDINDLDKVNVVVYKDNNNTPGEEIYNSDTIAQASGPDDTNINVRLPEPLTLDSGTYWISVYPTLTVLQGRLGRWFWSIRNNPVGSQGNFIDRFDSLRAGFTDWVPLLRLANSPDTPLADFRFQLFGNINMGRNILGFTKNEVPSQRIWPNPSEGIFNFSLNHSNVSQIQIFNINGALIHNFKNVTKQSDYSWDASNLPTGIYTVKISDGASHNTFKIIKK